MSPSPQEALSRLAIPPEKKGRRKSGPVLILVFVAAAIAVGLILFAATGKTDRTPISSPTGNGSGAKAEATPAPAAPAKPGDIVLTVSGYVIPRERIAISPKFQGTVTWIGVKKGDAVKKDDVLVKLEDSEQRARVQEAQGQLALAEAQLTNALINFERQQALSGRNIDSVSALDEARRARDTAAAQVTIAQGQLALAQTYLDWCTIRAPIDGTILEKLVNPNELVTPQSFGGGRGPSTTFLAMADLRDLQVEVDLSEVDTPKVHLNQPCRISPEAYPDRKYDGRVAEIAPEANRSKGTLQVKVQIKAPDESLTPELTAKVDFLKE
jgi:RND family efflux transporter MFP subunit